MYSQEVWETASNILDEPIPDQLPEALPLLDSYRCERRRPDLSNVQALFIQHHLGPLIPRFKAMVDDGLRPEHCWFVDIPYSTSRQVSSAIASLGVPKANIARPFTDPLAPYSSNQLARVSDYVRILASKARARRVLVVDDGAYFTRAVTALRGTEPEVLESLSERTAIVEQTTRGHRHLKEAEHRETLVALRAPVVSIARCRTKTDFESPFIGASVARGLIRALEQLGNAEKDLGRTAVIGFGAVGRATVSALQGLVRQDLIDVVETDGSVGMQRAIRSANAVQRTSLSEHPGYEVVVGCTGYRAFNLEDRAHLADDSLLVSASSAAVEFNRSDFVELAKLVPDDEIEILDPQQTRKQGIRANIRFRDNDRELSFIHAGFPINFDGHVDNIPARFIQATHVLLYAATAQVLAAAVPGFSGLSDSDDAWILGRACRYL